MSTTQIAVRLSERSVEFIDRLVADGHSRSRASYLEALLEREIRRHVDEHAWREGRYAVSGADDLDGGWVNSAADEPMPGLD